MKLVKGSISIAIVDDDEARAQSVEDYILSQEQSEQVEIEIICVSSTAAARELLFRRQVDVLIIDIVLPSYEEGIPHEGGGLSLIEEVFHSSVFKRPRYLVGVSAHDNAKSLAEGLDIGIVWEVVRTGDRGRNWLGQIWAMVKHAIATRLDVLRFHKNVDVLWLTALRNPEFEAVLNLRSNWEEYQVSGAFSFFYSERDEDSKFSIAALCQSTMGGVEAAIISNQMLNFVRPKCAIMSGICGGAEGQIRLGDIAVAREAWDWHGGKQRDGFFHPDVCGVMSSSALLSVFSGMAGDSDFLIETWKTFSGSKPDNPPNIEIGAMASGSQVIASKKALQEIASRKRKTVAVDMESFGFQYAARSYGADRVQFITVKGVSDFADSSKNDDIQKYAAYVSARAVNAALLSWASGGLPCEMTG